MPQSDNYLFPSPSGSFGRGRKIQTDWLDFL